MFKEVTELGVGRGHGGQPLEGSTDNESSRGHCDGHTWMFLLLLCEREESWGPGN